jgi:hypothetical protein
MFYLTVNVKITRPARYLHPLILPSETLNIPAQRAV